MTTGRHRPRAARPVGPRTRVSRVGALLLAAGLAGLLLMGLSLYSSSGTRPAADTTGVGWGPSPGLGFVAGLLEANPDAR